MTIRIVVCLDVDTDSIEEAYRSVCKELNDVGTYTKSRVDWESSDEWYGPYGEPVDVDTISTIRLKVLEDLDDEADDVDGADTATTDTVATDSTVVGMKAHSEDKDYPCPHCEGPNSLTWFVQRHPFNKQLEIRRCCYCGRDSTWPVGSGPRKK